MNSKIRPCARYFQNLFVCFDRLRNILNKLGKERILLILLRILLILSIEFTIKIRLILSERITYVTSFPPQTHIHFYKRKKKQIFVHPQKPCFPRCTRNISIPDSHQCTKVSGGSVKHRVVFRLNVRRANMIKLMGRQGSCAKMDELISIEAEIVLPFQRRESIRNNLSIETSGRRSRSNDTILFLPEVIAYSEHDEVGN